MPRHLSLDEAMAAVRSREQLRASGMTARAIGDAVVRGELRRLQRNRYVGVKLWNDLWPESRHLIEVCAAVAEMRDGDGVASHESAGVVAELPLYRHTPSAVHLLKPEARRGSSRVGLQHHADLLPAGDITVVNGIRCTTLDRTVFDLVRTLSMEAAVAVADAALRREAMRGSAYDERAAEAWRERMLQRCEAARGGRGVRQAEAAIRFADGRSESPGEAVSRLQLSRLGFRELRLQVPVSGPDGRTYRVDIGIEDVRSFYEFDGMGKYDELALASGKTVKQVVLDEKRREDWIRGATQRRFARAEAQHILTAEALGRRLAAFGITPPRR
ncbi:hypothetical protein J2X03_000965 [Microbacterium trichothecenolyticum]|uniref:hypothetical protein n=1 Tax=Microbacterium trichothecenolyticum TaxID=69370 RepID=UPI002861DDBA|nr:hypothetical protein [Microbacterium trichothecenolyticum]MDR7111101.1 hypothetical protein [Microbacterium trichothecenolyticum]